MDADDETKEEDPVVREIDVVLADWGDPTDDAPRPGLALLQYPIRARERGPEPFDAARIKVRHAAGALRDGILRIAPLATTYQMRPAFAYVDAADEADAPAPAPASSRDAPKLQAASVKRVPSTRDQSHARGSYAQRRQEQEAEPWLKLEVRQKDEEPSRAKRKKLNPTGSES